MAIDSRQKRASAIHVGCPWRVLTLSPGGAVDAEDRLHVAGLYAGIAAASVTVSGPSFAGFPWWLFEK